MVTSKARVILIQAVAAIAFSGAASAASYTWNSANAGNWSDLTANGWNNTAYPNALGDTATFSQDITAARTVTINVADAKVGALTLSDTTASHSWTVARTGTNTLSMDNGAGAATIVSTSGANVISAPVALSSNLDVTVTGTSLTLSAPLSGAKALTLNAGSSGQLILGGSASHTYSGATTVNGGTLLISKTINNSSSFTVASGATLKLTGYNYLPDGTTITSNGGTLDFSGKSDGDYIGRINGSGSMIMGSTTALTFGSGSAMTYSGAISGGGASSSLTFEHGTNTFTLSGTSTYAGKLIAKGLLKFGVANAVPNAFEVSLENATRGKVDLAGYNQSFVSISGGGASGGAVLNSATGTSTLTITGGNGKNFAGSIRNGSATQIVGLTINATGTQILSGINTYTGPTTIDNGTLVVNGSLTSMVTINGGALGGTGTVGGVSVGAAGELSPGASTGLLNSGSISLAGSLVVEVNGATAGALTDGYDQLNVTGTVDLLAGSNLDFLLGYTPDIPAFTLISNDDVDPITGAFSTVNGLAVTANQFTVAGKSYTLDYAGGDGNDLVVLVPEPGVLASLAAAMGLVSMRRRRCAR